MAGNPDRVGYDESWFISWFMAPWKFAADIVEERERIKFDQIFYNEILGLPYEPKEAGVQREHIIRCMRRIPWWPWGKQWKDSKISLGVDWGDISWVVARGRDVDPISGWWVPRILGVWQITNKNPLEHAPEVARIFAGLGANGLMVCDAGYGRDRNEWLAKRFPGKVFAAYYPVMEKSSKTFRPQWQTKQGKVTMDRTSSLKLTMREFTDREVILPGVMDERMEEYIKHFTSMRVSLEIDPITEDLTENLVAIGNHDHYVHASNYCRVAFEGVFGYAKPRKGGETGGMVGVSTDTTPRESERRWDTENE